MNTTSGREQVVGEHADLRVAGVVLPVLDAQHGVVREPGLMGNPGKVANAVRELGHDGLKKVGMFVHTPILGTVALFVKVFVPLDVGEDQNMEKKAAATLALNVNSLMKASDALGSQGKIAAAVTALDDGNKVNQTTIGYVLRATHSPRLDLIERIAKVFDVEPWQLLAPRLGASLHVIEGARVVPVMARPPPEVKPAAKRIKLATSAAGDSELVAVTNTDAIVRVARRTGKKSEHHHN